LSKPRLRWTFLFAGIAQSLGMLVEAYQIFRRVEPEGITARPWARLIGAIGFDAMSFGPILLVLGIAWIVATAAVLRDGERAKRGAVIVAAATFWYVVMGTGLSVIYLIALASMRRHGEVA